MFISHIRKCSIVFSNVCTYTSMHINQHLENSFCYHTYLHLIDVLIHFLASVHAERTCIYSYEVAQVAVNIVGVSLSYFIKSIVQELTTYVST